MSILKEMKACEEGLEWADAQTDYRTAWKNCERADWMLWTASKLNVDLRKIMLAKVACARTVQHLMKDERSLAALDVAEKFGKGEATSEELDAAVLAAVLAAEAVGEAVDYATAEAPAAEAAIYTAAALAAEAADASIYAADAYAADAATAFAAADAYAAEAADVYQAYLEALKEMADLVRQHIKFDDLDLETQR